MLKRESILLILVAIASLFAGYGLYQLNTGEVETTNTGNRETVLSAIPFIDKLGAKSVLGDWKGAMVCAMPP